MIYENGYMIMTFQIALFLIIPGPTNTLLLCSGFKHGFIKSTKLILAEWLGYLISVTGWGLLFTYLSQHGILILSFIKLCSAFYVIYLAIKVWKFSLHQISGHITTATVFTTTLLNPKAFVFADSIIPPSAFLYQSDYVHAMLCLFAALLPISFIWTYSGALIKTTSHSNHGKIKPTLFYRGASFVISLFAISMFYKSASMMF